MVSEASHKVPEGKMVKLKLETKGSKVEKASIRGDFFLEPADKLGELEEKLEGLETDADETEIIKKLEEVEVDMIGFSSEDVAKAFEKALEGDEE